MDQEQPTLLTNSLGVSVGDGLVLGPGVNGSSVDANGAVVGAGAGLPRSETESEDEDVAGPAVEGVSSQGTFKGDEAWTEAEEQELLRLATDEAYRKEQLGEGSTKWGPIAAHFQRTIKAVKRKFDKLHNQDREGPRRGAQPKVYPHAEAVLQRIQAQMLQAQWMATGGGHAALMGSDQQQMVAAMAAAAAATGLSAEEYAQQLQHAQGGQHSDPAMQGQHPSPALQGVEGEQSMPLEDSALVVEHGLHAAHGAAAVAQAQAEAHAQLLAAAQQQQAEQQAQLGRGDGDAGKDAADAHAAALAAHQAAAAAAVAAQHQHALPMVDPMGPASAELLAGMYMDPSSLAGAMPLLGHGLSVEDAAALQVIHQQGGIPLHIAHSGLDAVALAQAHAHAAVASAGLGGGERDAAAAQQLAQAQLHMLGHHHGGAGAVGLGLADPGSAAGGAMPGGAGTSSAPAPKKDRQFWSAEEQQELLRLASDPAQRSAVLGTADLNWDLVAKHLGRGKRSVQRKYDNLRTGLAAPGGASALPAKDGQKWTAEEVAELTRLVEDPVYLKEKLGLDKIDWRVLGQHFNRSYETVSYKVSYMKNTQRRAGEPPEEPPKSMLKPYHRVCRLLTHCIWTHPDLRAVGPDGQPLVEGRQHKKARHETSYKDMAAHALQLMPNLEGTSGEICSLIQSNPQYLPQLDMAIVSGKKTLPRWKHGVRSALNAFNIFERTGGLREGEVVWRLNASAVQMEAMAQQGKAERRSKSSSGTARRKVARREREEAGLQQGQMQMVEMAGEQEEGAQQALAQLAQQVQAQERPRRKRRASAVLLADGEYVPGSDEGDELGQGEEGGMDGGGGGLSADAVLAAQQAQHVQQLAEAQQAQQLTMAGLHPDALAAMIAAQQVDPAVLQAISEAQHHAMGGGGQQAPDMLHHVMQAQHMAPAQQQMGYSAALQPQLLEDVPPELQHQYQAQVAQHFIIFQQQQAAAAAATAEMDPSAVQHAEQDGGQLGYDPSQQGAFLQGAEAGDSSALASYLQALQQEQQLMASSQGMPAGMHLLLSGQQEEGAPGDEGSGQHHVQVYLPHQQGGQPPNGLGPQEAQLVGVLQGAMHLHHRHHDGGGYGDQGGGVAGAEGDDASHHLMSPEQAAMEMQHVAMQQGGGDVGGLEALDPATAQLVQEQQQGPAGQ